MLAAAHWAAMAVVYYFGAWLFVHEVVPEAMYYEAGVLVGSMFKVIEMTHDKANSNV